VVRAQLAGEGEQVFDVALCGESSAASGEQAGAGEVCGSAGGRAGSGLGLAIVRDVAKSHGGTVFACTGKGGGAEVGFSANGSRLGRRTLLTAGRPESGLVG
jgi:hypothetical protein